jgi:hypothetical protein
MKSEYLDMEIDHIVYKCEKCGEEWIWCNYLKI